jgi:hypothetical protein
MRLFKVKVEYETVIRAESKEHIEKYAETYIREIDDPISAVDVVELEDIKDLPDGWDGECRPWGERDPYDRTIEQILKDVKD